MGAKKKLEAFLPPLSFPGMSCVLHKKWGGGSTDEGSEYLEAKEMQEEGSVRRGSWWLMNGSGREGDRMQASVSPVSKEERS